MMTKNILLMNVNWLGDVLFSTPAIKALKRESEGGRIYVLIHPRCLQMLENNPNIDELIIYDEDGIHKGIFGKLKLIRELKRKNIEVAYLLHRSFTRALIAYLSGIPKRVGYFYKKRSIFLTDNIKLKDVRKVHRADFYLGVLEGSGIKVTEQDKKIEFYINDEDRLAVAGILKKEGIGDTEDIIVLNPGANWLPKRWSAENFASLADNLIEQYSKRLIISGSKNDQGLVDEIASLMKNTSINLSGKTNLKQLAALFEKALLVISADSGPLHLACAVGTQSIGLYGPTSVTVTGPYNADNASIIQKLTDCRQVPCYEVNCKDNRCMKNIKVSDVLREADKYL